MFGTAHKPVATPFVIPAQEAVTKLGVSRHGVDLVEMLRRIIALGTCVV
jgi:hypothetical protein